RGAPRHWGAPPPCESERPMPITLEKVGSHWDSSQAIRRRYAETGEDVILSFSRGKDAIAAWLALLDDGVKPSQIHPLYYDPVPGMRFIREDLDYWENAFETHIAVFPHPELFRQLTEFVWQPPTRTGYLCALGESLPKLPTFQDFEAMHRESLGLPAGTHVLTGVRATDSI